jgi:uncharacterized membrane protein
MVKLLKLLIVGPFVVAALATIVAATAVAMIAALPVWLLERTGRGWHDGLA